MNIKAALIGLPVPSMKVRYEDLTDNTEQALQRITEFIGVPYDAKMLNWSTTPNYLVGGNRMKKIKGQTIVVDNKWKSKTGLTLKLLHIISYPIRVLW